MAAQWYVKSIEDKMDSLLDAALSQEVRRAFDNSSDITNNQVVVNCRSGGNFEGNPNIYIVVGTVKAQSYMPEDVSGSGTDTFFYTVFNTIRQWTASSFTGLTNVTVDGLVMQDTADEDMGRHNQQEWNMNFYCTVS